jgi:hypothetical protein
MTGFSSLMISSLKSNNSLRRTKRIKNVFSKKINFESYKPLLLSEEENKLIIKENKRIMQQKMVNERWYALFLILLYGGIIAFGMVIFLQ